MDKVNRLEAFSQALESYIDHNIDRKDLSIFVVSDITKLAKEFLYDNSLDNTDCVCDCDECPNKGDA